MKEVLMMMLPTCPHCKRADQMINELITEYPEYASVQIRRVDESKEVAFANSLDYYYVPTFYVDGKKIMEGVPSKDKIEEALKAAMGEYPGISARSVEGMELRTQLKNYSISSEEQWPAEYL